MAHLDEESVKKLSELCRIDCTDEERKTILKNLEDILSYIDQLNEVNTDNVTPCNHVLADIANVMRDDIAGKPMPREVFLANAPAHTGGMIRVPPVITKKAQMETTEELA